MRAFSLWTFGVVVLVLAVVAVARSDERRRVLVALLVTVLATGVVAGPWYAYQSHRYTNPVFDRPQVQVPLLQRRPAAFYVDPELRAVFGTPFKTSLNNRFVPQLYTDGWGDYYGVFVWNNGDLQPGASAKRELRVQMWLAIVPTLLLVGGWLVLLARSLSREAPALLSGAAARRAAAARGDRRDAVLHRQLPDPRRRRRQGDVHAHDRAGLGALLRVRPRLGARAPAAAPGPSLHPARARRPVGAPPRALRLASRHPLRRPPLPSPSVTAVLFTCAGQRVDIVTAFGRAGATTIASDLDRLAPALYHADHMAFVPRVTDPGYLPALAALVAEYDVKLVVPVTDIDQSILARGRDLLEPALLLAPPYDVCATMADKYVAHVFFEEHGIQSPRTWLPGEVPADARYPLLVKIREGFGSRHIYRAADADRARRSSSATRRSSRWCRSSASARSSRSTSSATSRAAASTRSRGR